MLQLSRTGSRFSTAFARGILIPSLALGLAMPAQALVQEEAEPESPDTIHLPGTIRDFRPDHPDFNHDASVGYGHVAGNVHLWLADSGKPTFSNAGYRVSMQWKDRESQHIAPHLFTPQRSRAINVVDAPLIRNDPTIDSFNSSMGPYGGGNVGPSVGFNTGATMPDIPEPFGLPAAQGIVEFRAFGTTMLEEDINCLQFIVRNDHRLAVRGHVFIIADEMFKIENAAQIQLADADSSLTVYVRDEIDIENAVLINTVIANPNKVKFYLLSSNGLTIQNGVHVYAEVVSPEAPLYLRNNGQFYGRFTGLTAMLENTAGFHFDGATAADMCGAEFQDREGLAGLASSAGVSSAATFDQWYRDDLAVNLSMGHTLKLQRNAEGIYEYLDDEFYPINDRLIGNEGHARNNNFTFEATFSFVYEACEDQFFELFGKDDIYLYIDGQLVIDAGGILNGRHQRIDLDRLKLMDGRAYQAKFFYANRNPDFAKLNFRTNVEIEADQISPVASGGFD